MYLDDYPGKDTFCQLAEKNNVIPLCRVVLADMETPVSLLKKSYGNKGPIFLFESVEGGEKWGRYSFMGLSANAHLRVFKTYVDIQRGDVHEKIAHNGDPLAVMRGFMNQFSAADIPELPRFWGGLVGYLTYEFVQFFESVSVLFPDDTPLAHFVLPEEVVIFDNVKKTLTAVVITFLAENDSASGLYEAAFKRLECLLNLLNEPVKEAEILTPASSFELKSRVPEVDFLEQIKKTKGYIEKGEIIQSVISQPFTCRAPEDPLRLYQAQRYINPSPYMFFMHLDDTLFVGSSPETMVRLENRIATLRPIAGTRPRGKNQQEDRILADDLLSDEKERAEHLMLVDLGRNDLGRVAKTGTVQVTDLMVVERYSHVMHLISNISCDLKSKYDAFDLLRASFPAGTLSGAPKVRAMEIISELEPYHRGPYGGAVGYLSFHGNMDMAITIRTAVIEGDTLTVRAGAGIVYDSVPESEIIETQNKAQSVQKALKLVASWTTQASE